MKRSNLNLLPKALLLVLFLATILGCGGGGGLAALSKSFNLFITDDASATYSGVWVKLYKAQLVDSTGKPVVVFQSTEGLTVNLRQLNDGAAKFLLLAPGQVPDGSYTKVQFEVDKTVNLVAAANGAASTAVFPDSLSDPAGNSMLTLNLAPALVMPGAGKVIADFDLKNWNVVNGVISPVLKTHDGTGLGDSSRHEKFDFDGVIGPLSGTAPNFSFALTLKSGGTVNVICDDTTDVVGQGDNAGLVAGRSADVYGSFDPTTNSIKANVIKYDPVSTTQGLVAAIGLASNVDANGGTFDIAPKFTKGFAPKGATVSITTDGTTAFLGKKGLVLTKDQFFAALAAAGANANVDLSGTYNEGGNTIAAKAVHVDNEADFGSASAAGKTSNPDPVALTFNLAVSASEGLGDGVTSVKVQLSYDAQIKGPNGVVATNDQFFALLAQKSYSLGAKGVWNTSTQTLVASRIEYVVDVPVNFSAKGVASNPDPTGATFDFLPSKVSGIDLSFNSPVHVALSPNATFKAGDGSSMTIDAFFALLAQGPQTFNVTASANRDGTGVVINSVQFPAPVLPFARGTSSNPNSSAGTFDVTIAESAGFDAPSTLHVVLGDGVALKGPQGISINQAQLYSFLNEKPRNIRVTGAFANGVFTASKVELIFQ